MEILGVAMAQVVEQVYRLLQSMCQIILGQDTEPGVGPNVSVRVRVCVWILDKSLNKMCVIDVLNEMCSNRELKLNRMVLYEYHSIPQ